MSPEILSALGVLFDAARRGTTGGKAPGLAFETCEWIHQKQIAADCAEDEVCEFFFCGLPLPITKVVGSSVNPMAIK